MHTANEKSRFVLPPLTLLQVIIEFGIIIFVALLVTHIYSDMNPNKRLVGLDAEYALAAPYTISTTLHNEGYIPWWQHFLGVGDTVVNNPFAYILNPFLSLPNLIFGAINGMKVSLILMTILTGIGGWVLARILGLRGLARLVLGVLSIGKGNLHSTLSLGIFQLSMSQMYFPWLLAGIIGIFWYKHQRWPIALTAISFVLMFWVGLIWYVLPIVMLIFVLVATLVFRILPGEGRWWERVVTDWKMLRRMALAGIFTILLGAATLIPLAAYHAYIGSTTITQDQVSDLGLIVNQYFVGKPTSELGGPEVSPGYYNFVSPGWFPAFIYLLTVPALIFQANNTPPRPRSLWRLIGVLVLMTAFYTLWGAGLNPFIPMMYQLFPITTQFRHVERVLGVGSFLIVVLIAICVDIAWVGLVLNPRWKTQTQPRQSVRRLSKVLSTGLAIIIIGGVVLSTREVLSYWNYFNINGLEDEDPNLTACLKWFEAQNSNQVPAVWSLNYWSLLPFISNNVRFYHTSSDFYKPQPLTSTLFAGGDLNSVLPKVSQTIYDWDYGWEKSLGYDTPLPGTPNYDSQRVCFLTRSVDEFSYAFSIPMDSLELKTSINPDYLNKPNYTPVTSDTLVPADTTPITTMERHNDYVGLIVPGDPDHDLAVTISEVGYPGWKVSVNGSPATLEIIGGQPGVVLPKGSQNYQILFQYRPALVTISLILSLLSTLLVIAYLLHLDRFIPERTKNTVIAIGQKVAVQGLNLMLNPAVLGTDVVTEDDLPQPRRMLLLPTPTPQALPERVEGEIKDDNPPTTPEESSPESQDKGDKMP